jgi:hypothetical protein
MAHDPILRLAYFVDYNEVARAITGFGHIPEVAKLAEA